MIQRFPRIKPKRTIINLRGTNGSGKSTVIERRMETFGATRMLNNKGKLWAYRVDFEPKFYVLGDYEEPLGGCDGIHTMADVAKGVRRLAEKGNVVFEGIIVSILTKPWIQLAHSMPDAHFIFATLDTPLEKCIERVRKRRKEMGIKGEYDPKNLIVKYRAVWHAHKILKKAGLDVRRLNHKYAKQNLVNMLLEDSYGQTNEDS